MACGKRPARRSETLSRNWLRLVWSVEKSSPVVFHDPKTGVRPVVHGDDFTFLGFETELQQVKGELQRSYQLKVRAMLGDSAKHEKTVVILNRKLVWKEDCIKYEADEQHAQKVWSVCVDWRVCRKDWTRRASGRIQGTTMKMTSV